MRKLLLAATLFALTPPACQLGDSAFGVATLPSNQATAITQPATPAPVATPAPTTPPPSTSNPPPSVATFKALWSGKNTNADEWTLDAEASIAKYGNALLEGPSDVTTFCPAYYKASTAEKIDFFVQMLAAMAKYESGWDPAMQYTERSMGTDPVTGQQTVSEGLLQLSYSDELNYKTIVPAGVCDFDFQGDKRYGTKDLRRSILDPKTNLTCAIGILNHQVEKYGKLAVSSGAYWAVIKTDRSTNKLSEIRAVTKALPFCQ